MNNKELDKKLLAAARDGKLKTVQRLLDEGAKLDCRNRNDNSPLMLAVKGRHADVIDFLMQQHQPITDDTQKNLIDALMTAIEHGHIDEFDKLVATGININGYHDQHKAACPLALAVSQRNITLVDRLLHLGANPNHHISDHHSILISSVLTVNSDADIVRLLLDMGADVNFRKKPGRYDDDHTNSYSSLSSALNSKNIDIINCLLDDQYGGVFPQKNLNACLILAIEKDKLQIVEKLVKKGAEINAPIPKNGNSWIVTYPLMEAARLGRSEIFDFLAAQDSNFIKNEENHSSLMSLAINAENASIVGSLLDYGVNPDIKYSNGFTALNNACINGHINIVKTLIAHGSDINIKNIHGNTALHTACYHGRFEIAKQLVEEGANINDRGEINQTPFQKAIESGHFEIAEYLYSKGATDINDTLEDGETLLMKVAKKYAPENVEALIKWGAIVDATDRSGKSALMHACDHFFVENMEMLVKYGADINRKNRSGNSALMIACRNTEIYGDLLEALIKNGADVNSFNLDGENVLSPIAKTHLIRKNIPAITKILAAGFQNNESTKDTLAILVNNLAYSTADEAVDAMKNLLPLAPEINYVDENGLTPLMNAIKSESLPKVKMLINAGADIDTIKSPFDGSALDQVSAADFDNQEIRTLVQSTYDQRLLEKSIASTDLIQSNFSF